MPPASARSAHGSQSLGSVIYKHSGGVIPPEVVLQIQDSLLDWYNQNKRDLPWRDHPDPYAVWISEIMLQQTTVAAVIPFFTRWMQRFPTVTALAAAPVDEVLVHWAGLGYYARARNLHKSAGIIAESFSGQLPRSLEELKNLPGIGDYTAAAIASIAYGADVPAVDANITRVVSRLGAIPGDPIRETAAKRAVNELAVRLVPPGRASEFNQAMMDLGSSLCLSDRTSCPACPLQHFCAANRLETPTAFPAIVRKQKTEGQRDISVAITDDLGKLLLMQRPALDPLWGGLWEMPRVSAEASETLEEAARRAVSLVQGLDTGSLMPFGSLKHVVGNRKITLYGYAAVAKTGMVREEISSVQWTAIKALPDYALATPQRRLIAQYLATQEQPSLDLGELG